MELNQDILQLVFLKNFVFENHKDMSLQIDYVIYFADKTNIANIIYWLPIKCKQVIRNILAAEMYGMALRFDIKAVIKAILGKMLKSAVPLILYTNSKSLYNCLV